MILTKKKLAEAAKMLAAGDEDLAVLFAAEGVPPLWARSPGFSTLIHIILEQQVSLASALAMYRRLKTNVMPFTPQRFLDLGSSYLRSLGVTRQKAAYCLNVAKAVTRGRISLKTLSAMDDPGVVRSLTQVSGVGPWTAHIYLLMAMRRPDVWPAGDLALARAVRKIKGLGECPSPEEMTELAEPWRPYRSVAARILWQHYLSENFNPPR